MLTLLTFSLESSHGVQIAELDVQIAEGALLESARSWQRLFHL